MTTKREEGAFVPTLFADAIKDSFRRRAKAHAKLERRLAADPKTR